MSVGEVPPHGEMMASFMVEWRPRASLPFFADHFPGNPIVPAFQQVAYLRNLVASRVGIEPTRAVCRSVKFLRPIKPDSRVEIRVESSGAAASVSFAFSLEVDGVIVTKGELALS